MNYLMALIFMVLVSMMATEVKRTLGKLSEVSSVRLLLVLSLLVTILVVEFILLSHGFARIMGM